MEFFIRPWEHQLQGINMAKDKNGFAFFFETGTGKTGTCINTLRFKCNEKGRLLRTLIFCPPIVTYNWKEEFAKHSKITEENIVVLGRSQKYRCRDMRAMGFKTGDSHVPDPVPRIFVTNYESLMMAELFMLFETWKPEVIIFDECHYLKSIASKRSKLAYKLAHPAAPTQKQRDALAPIKYLLSGTPFLSSPLDIFQQYKIMDGGATFGTNFFTFRSKYCVDRNAKMPKSRYFPKWQAKTYKKDGVSSYDSIGRAIKGSSLHVLKEDCLDLPPLVKQVHKIDMIPAQARMYRDMKKDFIAYLNEDVVVAPLALTKAMRLMQITSGFYKTDEGEEKEFDKTPKRTALEELLESITPRHKVLIWAVWKKNYEQIRLACENVGVKYVEVHGDVKPADKYEAVDKFNNEKSVRVLFGHPGSGGIGINLVEASYSIFYSRTFSYEQSVQAEARNYRGGSEKHDKITRIDLVAKDTLDEDILTKLSDKQRTSEQILSFVKESLK